MSILDHLLSAANTVGNVLDTPASMIRSALIGENPLTAAVDTSQRHSMRDVLEKYGVLGPNEQGLDAGDAAAFALNMAIDPLNWIGGLGFVKNLLKSHALSKMDDVAEAGFSPDVIKHLSGMKPSLVGPDDFSGWTTSLSEPEIQALEHWSSSDGYGKINHLLRGASRTSGGHPYDPFEGISQWGLTRDEAKDTADLLQAAINRSTVPKDALVYRRMGTGEFQSKGPGDVIRDPGFFATSTVNDADGSFYGSSVRPDSALADVLIPKGSRGGFIGGASKYGDYENELLLPPGGSYRVLAQRDIPLVSFHGEQSQPMVWVRGTSPQNIVDHFEGMGRTPDPWLLKMAAGEEVPGYTLSRSSQPNYLLEAIDGSPSLRRMLHHHMPGNQAILSALAGYNTARGFSGNQ